MSSLGWTQTQTSLGPVPLTGWVSASTATAPRSSERTYVVKLNSWPVGGSIRCSSQDPSTRLANQSTVEPVPSSASRTYVTVPSSAMSGHSGKPFLSRGGRIVKSVPAGLTAPAVPGPARSYVTRTVPRRFRSARLKN